jgi:hypothetical protein
VKQLQALKEQQLELLMSSGELEFADDLAAAEQGWFMNQFIF